MDQALMNEGSGHMAFPRAGRRAGWSDTENKLLWETADEAQQQGLPLKAVFEQIAKLRMPPGIGRGQNRRLVGHLV